MNCKILQSCHLRLQVCFIAHMPILFGLTLNFTIFVLVVVVAQVSTLFSPYFPFCFTFGI